MKKVIVQKTQEEAEYYCDKHPDRKCYNELKTCSWYGSKFDMMSVNINMCDNCLDEMYNLLEIKFGVKPIDSDVL